MLGITFINGKSILSEYAFRKSIGYQFNLEEVKWSKTIVIVYPLYAFIGGVMAGLLGIGGGLILGPLLLDLGVNPIISTATSNFLVLFTSSSTSLQFILLGMMNFNYGSVCTLCSTLGSFIGTIIIQKILERTKRASILIFALAFVLGASTIFIPGHTILEIKHKLEIGINIWVFGRPC